MPVNSETNRRAELGRPPDPDTLGPAFRRLCEIVARLRSPTGCPWDREQTLETIKPCTLEETYELLEAIDSGDDESIVEELGDVLLQVVLDAQIGADEGRFCLNDVVECLTDKLVRRHPHVFGNARAESIEEVTHHWRAVKATEKQRNSELDGIPKDLPQLARTARITGRAAKVGYDFPHRAMLFDKLREEITELACELFPGGSIPEMPARVDAQATPDEPVRDEAKRERIENEIGDVLFVVSNIARRWQVNPEEALRRSNRKFSRRFQAIERHLAAQGRSINEATLIEMEECYQAEKEREKSG